MPAQALVLSFPSLASLDALAEHFFDRSKHLAHNPTVPYAAILPKSGDATAEGSPGIAFESTTLTALSFLCMPSHC